MSGQQCETHTCELGELLNRARWAEADTSYGTNRKLYFRHIMHGRWHLAALLRDILPSLFICCAFVSDSEGRLERVEGLTEKYNNVLLAYAWHLAYRLINS